MTARARRRLDSVPAAGRRRSPCASDCGGPARGRAATASQTATRSHATLAALVPAHRLARSARRGARRRSSRGYRNVFIATVEADDLYAACRQQSATRLVAFAQRIEPRPRPDPGARHRAAAAPASALLARAARAHPQPRARPRRDGPRRSHAARAAASPRCSSAARAPARPWPPRCSPASSSVDLYRIDLAALVSKWVGETEKNLSRVFADAERANCMLFFDEADALFGRRGEVKEAQRPLGQPRGQLPAAADRGVLGRRHPRDQPAPEHRRGVPAPHPRDRRVPGARRGGAAGDLGAAAAGRRRAATLPPQDLDEIAQRFELTGGNIRNVVLDACFRALDDGERRRRRRATSSRAPRASIRSSSRPVTRGDFGRFYDWAMQDVMRRGRADGEARSVAGGASAHSGCEARGARARCQDVKPAPKARSGDAAPRRRERAAARPPAAVRRRVQPRHRKRRTPRSPRRRGRRARTAGRP